ncbi:ABC transporter permease [Rhodospira trueperi]|uniref:Molybdenum transport system permease n=1 Tax=Rhodospira trueperi TaxID=69960 RepID=A0A1G7I343_9PROT|nr:ABC transporter permease [Rhodospira trueperi]SDF07003.1 molybdate transport system permease protein [Rhodospira trueperi]
MIPLAVICAVPLVVIAVTVLGAVVALATHLDAADLAAVMANEETLFAIGLSLRTSLVSLALALVLGIPAAHLLARHRFPGKAVLETLLDLPLVTPPLVAGVGLLFLLGRQSPVGGGLAALGIDLLFSPAGIILAQTYVAASIVVRTARTAFQEVEPAYAYMAWTLGLSPGWAFLLVEVPMAARGLATAAVLGWARALGEFGATLMLAGATRMRTETLPMAVYLNIASGETGLAVACALILLAIAFALLLVVQALSATRPGPRAA